MLAALALALAGRAQATPVDRETRLVRPQEVQVAAADSIRYANRVADGNLVGMTITNYGFFGNNFVSRSPSLEYPLGSAFEHMVRGGLWIGGRALGDTGFYTAVTTGAVDGFQGTSAQSRTEFRPASLGLVARSTLINSRFYNPEAVSELDLLGSYSDLFPVPDYRPEGAVEPHRPLNVLVRQENYMWSFSDLQHFIIYRFVITNIGPPLSNVWVGFYSEFASGPKNGYPIWPPSSSGSIYGSWYGKKTLAYDDSLRLLREHYCAGTPIPESCGLNTVPYWIGKMLLGASPGTLGDYLLTVRGWDFDPGSNARDEDREKFPLLSEGIVEDISRDQLQTPNDPVALMSVGPFAQINPGDSVIVDFAIVGGAEIADIQKHAQSAQKAYDLDYRVPTPPPSPLMKMVAREKAIDIYWEDTPESVIDSTSANPNDFEGYRVYLGENRDRPTRVAEFDRINAFGFNTGLDSVRLDPPAVIDGVTYPYRFSVPALRDGFKYFGAVTSFDIGSDAIESLESGTSQNKAEAIPSPSPAEVAGRKVTVFPNPYRVEARWDANDLVRDHYLWFANLPKRCTIRIYTLGGDLVFDTDFDGATYQGQGARGIFNPREEFDVSAPTLSGSMYGWNMISKNGQAVATGLYMFSVEDKDGGGRQVGKFLIVKSDKEES